MTIYRPSASNRRREIYWDEMSQSDLEFIYPLLVAHNSAYTEEALLEISNRMASGQWDFPPLPCQYDYADWVVSLLSLPKKLVNFVRYGVGEWFRSYFLPFLFGGR
ncbi:MAG: hypothetical protein HY864_13405 [Chloroflexi bacterium]|nr:hypothetical protein [Chloroflexota bacterium]